jgi:hypothetical protein
VLAVVSMERVWAYMSEDRVRQVTVGAGYLQLQLGFLSMTTVYTLPVDPSTLNSSRSSSPFRLLSTMKNLAPHISVVSQHTHHPQGTHRCSITRSTLSKMFFGHLFLNTAPRFSSCGAPGSFVLRAFFFADGAGVVAG